MDELEAGIANSLQSKISGGASKSQLMAEVNGMDLNDMTSLAVAPTPSYALAAPVVAAAPLPPPVLASPVSTPVSNT